MPASFRGQSVTISATQCKNHILSHSVRNQQVSSERHLIPPEDSLLSDLSPHHNELKPTKKVRFSLFVSSPEMDHDDDDGVGYARESHYLKSPTVEGQQGIALLHVPRDGTREGSISSNVSDLDIPIYSSENLTTSSKRVPPGVQQLAYILTKGRIQCLHMIAHGRNCSSIQPVE
ncbi:hypothetical protein JTB14_024568 [Gonioctena quinquepunctata]|nr:hypothetical protein JTB14_024568 [Gonioctena quinquepunctata]